MLVVLVLLSLLSVIFGERALARSLNEKQVLAIRLNEDSSVRITFNKTFSAESSENDKIMAQFKHENIFGDSAAVGTYQDMNSTGNGWGVLEIETNGNFSDYEQAFTAGYLEGSLTTLRIFHTIVNTSPRATLSSTVLNFINENYLFIQSMVNATENANSSYWYQMGLILNQLDGLYNGFQSSCKRYNICQFDFLDFIILQLHGDLDDIESALKDKPAALSLRGSGSCSALIKLLPDFSDLLVSHVTWTGYNNMIRINKKYTFQFKTSPTNNQPLPGSVVVFASYPGRLLSGDDWYQTSSNLVILETTIGNENQTLYDQFVKPNTVLDWMRNIVANRLASSGAEWVDIFSQLQSGTYNNEWLIVDLKLFHSGLVPSSGLVWMIDQIPGYVVSKDLTSLLVQQNYIASYNVPYFTEIFNLNGGAAAAESGGDWYTYDKSPRALMFKRGVNSVNSLAEMQSIMRYNDFLHDPLAKCDCVPLGSSGENAISARSDLNPIDGTYPFSALSHRNHGGTDAKVTSASLMKASGANSLSSLCINGPTNENVPTFKWSTSTFVPEVNHLGHPDEFNFPWTPFTFFYNSLSDSSF